MDDATAETVDPAGARSADVHGARWWVAMLAVGAALTPAALVLALWFATGDDEPSPVLFDDGETLFDVYLASQLDPDECKADFAATAGAPTSERLPFYFC